MPETYVVRLPDGQVVTKQLPRGLSDEQIRAAFGLPDSPVQRLTNALHGNLQAPPDTLQSRGTDTIRNALAALGVDENYGQHVANKAFGFLNDLTPVGDAVSADDARMAWGRGDYPAAAGNALLAALGAVPAVGDAAAGVAKAIIAPLFHGSPHKFDKFSLDKIGTGEGAQAYGHGLYFAENPAVAREYRAALSGPTNWLPREKTEAHNLVGAMLSDNHPWPKAVSEVQDRFEREAKTVQEMLDIAPNDPALLAWRDRIMQNAADLRRVQPDHFDHTIPGHLYTVKLDAEPEDFLDWDVPLAQQPDPVRSAYADAAIPNRAADPDLSELIGTGPVPHDYLGLFQNSSGAQAYNTLAERSIAPNSVGLVAEHNAQRLAAERLRQSGVPGIRYLDQGSRGAGDGTRNYVVFDDSIIDILNRY